MVDRYSNTTKEQRFSDLPDHVKFKESTRICNGEEQTVKVSVAEIRVASIDGSGRLVPSERATALIIEYLDQQGNVLQSVRMKKN